MPTTAEQKEWLSRLTRKETLEAMRDCDRAGTEQNLNQTGFGWRQKDWGKSPSNLGSRDGDQKPILYPVKATVAAAMGKLPQPPISPAKEFFSGFGEVDSRKISRGLGFDFLIRPAPTASGINDRKDLNFRSVSSTVRTYALSLNSEQCPSLDAYFRHPIR
jgi:hypothetical protein